MPAPPARSRSASVPCGTTSSSILPAPYNSSNTSDRDERGNEQMILETRPASNNAARPMWPLPALLLTTVRSLVPWSMRAWISSVGLPASPKPEINTVSPSLTSATASAGVGMRLSIIRGPMNAGFRPRSIPPGGGGKALGPPYFPVLSRLFPAAGARRSRAPFSAPDGSDVEGSAIQWAMSRHSVSACKSRNSM